MCYSRAEEVRHHEDGEQRGVIKGKDPERAPRIEYFEVAAPSFRVEQDAGDEESRQHEKQVDARPPESEGVSDGEYARRFDDGFAQCDVEQEDEEDGAAAKAIERRDMRGRERAVERAGLCHIAPVTQSHRSDLNRRPLDYESRALPLSYGGEQIASFYCHALERTRTATPCGTTPSRWRVYQFHHQGNPNA